MGYSSSGGPKGLGTFNNTPTTTADLQQLVTLIARMGNLRVETETNRDAINGAALYEGLHVYNLTTHQTEYYNGSGWVGVNDPDEVVSLIPHLSSGYNETGGAGTAHEPRLYVRGREVVLAGGVSRIGAALVTDMMVIPSQYRPGRSGTHFIGAATISSGQSAEFTLSASTGTIGASYVSGTFGSGAVIPLARLGWFLD
jgi:hypothetical protein